ncbi:hypothetical protein BP6252_12982 [Coleophoma cylindrospora]|uniref:Uncharacterized protein n=1 Tax=Coleophoma cylindrospora TaxID=1849047 RepID=A0A3D8QDI9_9HELO|nr:hypothetical protein BP6252_12982 [Coleophoma cylindrospora]
MQHEIPAASDAQGLGDISVLELLGADSRPVFAVDVVATGDTDQTWDNIAFSNPAFKDYSIAKDGKPSWLDRESKRLRLMFEAWIHNGYELEVSARHFSFAGVFWTKAILRQRWCFVFGDRITADASDSGTVDAMPRARLGYESTVRTPMLELSDDPMEDISTPAEGSADITWIHKRVAQPPSEFVKLFCSVDWASTALGPMEEWPVQLQHMTCLLLADSRPVALFWGPSYVMLYNEGYIDVAGPRHPAMLGSRGSDTDADTWTYAFGQLEQTRLARKMVCEGQYGLSRERYGDPEETTYRWSILPVMDDTGLVAGYYIPIFDTTRLALAERRYNALSNLAETVVMAKSIKAYWEIALSGLECLEADIPFAVLYSIDRGSPSELQAQIRDPESLECQLEGSIGIPDGHPIAPTRLNLGLSAEALSQAFVEAMKSSKPTMFTVGGGIFTPSMFEGIQWRGFGDACKAVVICPIRPTNDENVVGFLFMGLNPRSPYNEGYQQFVSLMSVALGASVASLMLFEDEARRGEHLARRLLQSEDRLTKFAEVSPIGMYIVDAAGNIVFHNKAWAKMTGYVGSLGEAMDWLNLSVDEDVEISVRNWKILLEEKIPVVFEARIKKPWMPPNLIGTETALDYTWVQADCFPEIDENGNVKNIIGCLSDISHFKWAISIQEHRVEEALEAKRQQENFIDMTSHEIRNPLSAVIQCSDSIASALDHAEEILMQPGSAEAHVEVLLAHITESKENSHTVLSCAQHQKRIVDDILTMSKLDANLLLITPVCVQPVETIRDGLRMFAEETARADIKVSLEIDNSILELQIDWLCLDPSRLLQVLINLLTNAIKFTKTEEERNIVVKVAASRDPSTLVHDNVKYISTRTVREDLTLASAWGDGEILYFYCAVMDSGRGLNAKEKENLFLRFSQASPRTHIQYGGSGLGLFICRELAELQGGEIGVASEGGVGSTFAFYIKARRTAAAQAQNEGAMISPRKFELTNCSVLVVEDNLINQNVLRKQLERLGCTVYVANHGEEALAKLEESNLWTGNEVTGIDLSIVLLDIEMPIMDGLTCIRKIRQLERDGRLRPHIPVIAVSANARLEQIENAKACGMNDVISKPFRIPDLIPKMERLLQSKKS